MYGTHLCYPKDDPLNPLQAMAVPSSADAVILRNLIWAVYTFLFLIRHALLGSTHMSMRLPFTADRKKVRSAEKTPRNALKVLGWQVVIY